CGHYSTVEQAGLAFVQRTVESGCVLGGVAGVHSARGAGARHRRLAGVHLKVLPLPAKIVCGTVHCVFRIGGCKLLFPGCAARGGKRRLPLASAVSNLDSNDHCYFCSDHGIRTAWVSREDNPGRVRDCLRRADAWPCHRVWPGRPGLGKRLFGKKIPQGKAGTETGRTFAVVVCRGGKIVVNVLRETPQTSYRRRMETAGARRILKWRAMLRRGCCAAFIFAQQILQ